MVEAMEIDPPKGTSETWTEKYRPKTLNDVAHQEEVVTMLKGALTGKDLPHLLFYGPPGTGKTSAALAFCHELYPKNVFKDRVLELNASDERGISVVRNKISFFSKRAINQSENRLLNVKIVILDEVDAMTRDAQSAMRRVIEDCSKTTRFILICNYVSRLIAPIVSRCAKFRFKSLPAEVQIDRLRTICNSENTPLSEEDLKIVMKTSEGDLRRAVCTLQSLAPVLKNGDEKAKNSFLHPTNDSEIVKEIVSLLPSAKVPQVFEIVKRTAKSCSGVTFLRKVFDEFLEDDLINDDNIAIMGKLVAKCEKRILDGCDLQNNLLDFLLTLRSTFIN
ncbi:unnamed protein product [Caenorhabditis angaria]|uniref:AAA+ ATPase domain-containing protein n=1 Tax=Caenorhabditis angaria TaxID=860376 RepID=A0A9P1IGH5_9PELO|nr:unnamed protein product [Caenorhabditis angaria]